MKKIKYALFAILASASFVGSVFATPSQSISVNRSQIEAGQSVTATVTLKNVAAWNIKVNGTGNTNGCSTKSADATSDGKNTTKTFKVTCAANSTGVIRIAYSGDATSADGSTVDLDGSKTINVVAARVKSSNNNLKSLSIDGLSLSPEFNKDTLSYTTTAEAGTERIVINAEKADGYASLTGTGEFEVSEGDNSFDVVVTSETGVSKTYTINVVVKEFAPIIVNVGKNEYSIVRKVGELKVPNGYVVKPITISENQIESLYNESLNKTLVYLKDKNDKSLLFTYEDGKYERYYEYTFKELTINVLNMKKDLLPKGYNKFNIMFNDEEIEVYKLSKDSNYGLVYALDTSTGDENLYQIDLKNNTAQIFNEEFKDTLLNCKKKILISIGSLLGIIFIEFIFLIVSKGKRKKILKKINQEKIDKVKTKAINDSKKEKNIEKVEKVKTKAIDDAKKETVEVEDDKKKKSVK